MDVKNGKDIIKNLSEKPINESFKSRNNKHFKDKKHRLLNVSGMANNRVKTEAGDVQFENDLAVLPEDGQGDEIEAELRANATHPGQVGSVQKRERYNSDQIHRYHFGQFPGVPWAKYDELGRRIHDDE